MFSNSTGIFKGLQKRLSSISSNIFSGPPPIKLLKNALEAGDEEKAIEIYTTVPIDGKSGAAGPALMDLINPSEPFPSKKSNSTFQTPLHLAAKMSLYRIFILFLEHGGNPNASNGRGETCLHCVCQGSDRPLVRREIMEYMLNWEVVLPNGQAERLSVNHVDDDGNIALHYAAANELTACVERLVQLGSILSLVNKSQMTCCEMADENNFKDMASMLELSILFQPNDGALLEDATSPTNASQNATQRQGMLILDSVSMKIDDLHYYIDNTIKKVQDKLISIMNDLPSNQSIGMITKDRVEVMLNSYSWDANRLIVDFVENPSNVFTNSKLEPFPNLTTSNQTNDTDAYCTICGDSMESDLQIDELNRDHMSSIDISRRSLSCPAGHRYCIDCWRSHLSIQVKDNSGYCLSCPGYKCHEIVSGGHAWLDVLFRDDNTPVINPNGISRVSSASSNANTSTSNSSYRSPAPTTNASHMKSSSETPTMILRDRYQEQRARHVIDCCSGYGAMKWCPAADCGAVIQIRDSKNLNAFLTDFDDPSVLADASTNTQVMPKKASQDKDSLPLSVLCHNGHSFCTTCSSESHTPCSCDDWSKWQAKVKSEIQVVTDSKLVGSNNDDIANALWLAANTKRCPRCTSPIEKDEGCNHMSCRKCRHEFCWICMQDWSLHSNTTGGFFQCNRFVSELMEKNGGDDSSKSLSAAAEEFGNAHLETIRMRERGNKMARFIPLYTRLKAHSDSVTMEKRIFPETMFRIMQSLQNSCADFQQDSKKSGLGRDNLGYSNGKSTKSDMSSGGWMWLQKSNVIHPLFDPSFSNHSDFNVGNKYAPCLHELQTGFEELIKCRIFLIGCVAYSYNTFTETEEDNLDSLMRALARNRHHKYGQSRRLDEHKQSFERLQSDLEFYTEMLSDAVARRRLRASNSQIKAILSLARTKRLELEEIIYMHHLSEVLERQQDSERDKSSSLRFRGNRSASVDAAPIQHSRNATRSRRHSSAEEESYSSAFNSDLMNQFMIGPDGLVFMPDSDENSDEYISQLNVLFEHLDRFQNQHNQDTSSEARASIPTHGNHTMDTSAADNILHLLQSEGIYPTTSSQPQDVSVANSLPRSQQSRENLPQASVITPEVATSSNNKFSWFRRLSGPGDNQTNASGNISVSNDSIATSANSANNENDLEEIRLHMQDVHHTISSNDSSNNSSEVIQPYTPSRPTSAPLGPGIAITNPGRSGAGSISSSLTSRAEEEAALNHAILMSLSDLPPRGSNTAPTGGNTDTNQSSDSSFREADVDMLLGMGFSRSDVIGALTSSNGNLDQALNTLLGI